MSYPSKRLGYPYSYRTVIEQDDNRVFTPSDPATVEDCNFYVLNMTNDEKRKIGSALYAGLDLLYPDEFISLFQIWLQSREYPNSFPPPTGVCSVDLCDLILQCINDTPEIQQAIAGFSVGSSTTNTTQDDPVALAGQLMNGRVGCDNDNIYGMALQLVEFLDAVAEDILELFVQAPSAIARLGDIIEAIPAVGELPVDDAFQFVESVMTQWNSAYQAAFTQQLKVEIACDLFCIAQTDCTLTLVEVRDYYRDKLAGLGQYNNQLEFIEDLLVYNWIGTATVYGLHLLIIQAIAFGGEVLGFDVNKLISMVNSMYNDPNPDWVTNCTGCATWEYEIDFTVEDGVPDGWAVDFGWGDGYDPGVGWDSEFSNPYARQLLGLKLTLPQDTQLTYFEFEFAGVGNFPNLTDSWFAGGYRLDAVSTETYRQAAGGQPVSLTRVMYDGDPVTVDEIWTGNNPKQSPVYHAVRFLMRGTGANPYG